MNDLAQQKCVACRGTEPILTEAQIAELQPQVPEWQVKEVGDMKRLERVFKFKNFAQALEFTNKVGAASKTPPSPDILKALSFRRSLRKPQINY